MNERQGKVRNKSQDFTGCCWQDISYELEVWQTRHHSSDLTGCGRHIVIRISQLVKVYDNLDFTGCDRQDMLIRTLQVVADIMIRISQLVKDRV